MELKKYKLGEIADIIGGVAYRPSDICDYGIRILRGGNINSRNIMLKDDDVFLPLSYTDQENQVHFGDTILVASTGSVDVLGKAATCFEEIPFTQIGAFLRIIRPKEQCYTMLISIAVNSEYFAKYIKSQARGTSINNITINYLKEFEIYCPTNYLPICNLYSILENKILLNRKINQNLEAMAKQLYDYWFVQFDFPNEEGKPYKSSGGAMVYNERLGREIPQGWSTLPISEILDKYPTTKRYETKEYLSCGKYPIIDQGDSFIIGFTNEIDHLLTRHPAVLFGDHSTKVKFLDFDFARGADGTQILYSSSKAVSQYYLYLAVSALQIPNPGYSRHFKYLKELPIIIPDLKIANKFENIVKPLFDEWTKNIFCNIELIKQRNELLPLLMNGQASIG